MSTAHPDVRATPAPSGDLRVAQGQSTRALLLAAAADLLREEGYAATSTRAVAERAGARLSLVHYHFGSKRSLLLAVLEDLTERLLQRQQAMFSDGRSFAEQWRSACDYLREDVDSGYVRILWELWAAGLADPELAERWRATQRSWRKLIEARLERLQTERGAQLPMRPRALAPPIGNLFEGAEVEILAGVTEDETPHLEALDACAELIAWAER
jgi:AcrR family transcriptional regulator